MCSLKFQNEYILGLHKNTRYMQMSNSLYTYISLVLMNVMSYCLRAGGFSTGYAPSGAYSKQSQARWRCCKRECILCKTVFIIMAVQRFDCRKVPERSTAESYATKGWSDRFCFGQKKVLLADPCPFGHLEILYCLISLSTVDRCGPSLQFILTLTSRCNITLPLW